LGKNSLVKTTRLYENHLIMKRGNFIKSVLALAAAPLAIGKGKAVPGHDPKKIKPTSERFFWLYSDKPGEILRNDIILSKSGALALVLEVDKHNHPFGEAIKCLPANDIRHIPGESWDVVNRLYRGDKIHPTEFLDQHDFNLHMDHELYTFAMHKCGDPKKAADLGTWYHKTMKYWLKELRKDPNFHKNPTKSAQLAQFEGQTFDNLWKLFRAQQRFER
jgi:hypothetical protein